METQIMPGQSLDSQEFHPISENELHQHQEHQHIRGVHQERIHGSILDR